MRRRIVSKVILGDPMTTDLATKKYLAGEMDARAFYAELKKQVSEEMDQSDETVEPEVLTDES